jgi:hypothetical protein
MGDGFLGAHRTLVVASSTEALDKLGLALDYELIEAQIDLPTATGEFFP